jgi:hypothetical protein
MPPANQPLMALTHGHEFPHTRRKKTTPKQTLSLLIMLLSASSEAELALTSRFANIFA